MPLVFWVVIIVVCSVVIADVIVKAWKGPHR